jgi:hypothetical protein
MGTERVRVCLHAGNTEAQIADLVRNVQSWVDTRVRMKSQTPVEREVIETHDQLIAKL